jgi:hypothetical protein
MGRPLSRQERLAIAAQPFVQPTMLPPPTKGWNVRDSLAAMDPQDAVVLDNWFPTGGGVVTRNGYISYAMAGTSPVKTLVELNTGANRKFLAAANGSIFDISAGGSGISLKSGFANDGWQTTAFLGRLFLANGADTVQVYDTTTVADATFTGVPLNTLIGVMQYQQRLFFWQVNSTKFYFAPLNSISGALSAYDLSAFSPNGGVIVAITTYSHDGGSGVQDFVAFIMSSGDCLIFFGNDPSDATVWSLVGRYRISPPVSARAVCNYGAEAFLTTFDDHVPLQQQLVALKLGQLPPRSKISNAVQAAVAAGFSLFGWQSLYYPKGRYLLFNTPNPDGTFDQHICNTGSPDQPWSRFTNQNAFCWGLYNNSLYFGTANGTIYLADSGGLDGTMIVHAVGQQAWNTFGDPNRKRVSAARPLLQLTGAQSVSFGLGYDFGDLNITNAIATTGLSGSPWDTSPWDTSPWSPENTVSQGWRIAGGTGMAIGVGLNVAATEPVQWLRTDLKFEEGAAL